MLETLITQMVLVFKNDCSLEHIRIYNIHQIKLSKMHIIYKTNSSCYGSKITDDCGSLEESLLRIIKTVQVFFRAKINIINDFNQQKNLCKKSIDCAMQYIGLNGNKCTCEHGRFEKIGLASASHRLEENFPRQRQGSWLPSGPWNRHRQNTSDIADVQSILRFHKVLMAVGTFFRVAVITTHNNG